MAASAAIPMARIVRLLPDTSTDSIPRNRSLEDAKREYDPPRRNNECTCRKQVPPRERERDTRDAHQIRRDQLPAPCRFEPQDRRDPSRRKSPDEWQDGAPDHERNEARIGLRGKGWRFSPNRCLKGDASVNDDSDQESRRAPHDNDGPGARTAAPVWCVSRRGAEEEGEPCEFEDRGQRKYYWPACSAGAHRPPQKKAPLDHSARLIHASSTPRIVRLNDAGRAR